jgi:hypothetical protein
MVAPQPVGSPDRSLLGAAVGLVAGLLIPPVVAFWWFYGQASWRRLQDVVDRVASLEETRAALPSAHIRFEFDRNLQKVRLHVTNHGGEAEFSAPMAIDGALSTPLDREVFASWEHTSHVSTRITRGQTRVLHLATLDATSFPFAQWHVRVTSPGRGASDAAAMHTSVVGGLLDTQAPRMLLHVSLVSTPGAAGEVPSRTIALDPFSAELLPR